VGVPFSRKERFYPENISTFLRSFLLFFLLLDSFFGLWTCVSSVLERERRGEGKKEREKRREEKRRKERKEREREREREREVRKELVISK